MKLAHIGLWTVDVDAAASFWAHYFDAVVGDRYTSQNRVGFVSRFATLPGCDVSIEIMEGPWVTSSVLEACGWAHVALSVGSTRRVEQIAERFRIDALLISPPRRTGDGYFEAVVRTPDGTLIEIVE